MNYKHIVGLLVLVMFGALAFEFGRDWTGGIWALVVIAFLVFALTLVNPKLAKDLIGKLPSIIGKLNPLLKKEKNEESKK